MLPVLLVCVLSSGAPWGSPWGALAAGVAAEGPPVLGPLIGPAQERDAIARRQQQYGPHHLRHQHHYGDPRLSSRHPGPSTHAGDGLQQQPAAPSAEAPRLYEGRHAGDGHTGGGSCQLNPEQVAALMTKSLEGVCSQKETNDQFHNLGTQLGDQLNVLKTMILNLEDKVGAMDIGIERAERRLLAAVAKSRCTRGGPESEDDLAADAEDDALPPGGADEDDDDVGDYGDNPALVTTYRDGAQGPGGREEEVQRYNNTVHTEHAPEGLHPHGSAMGNTVAGCGHGQRVYTYFWRVRNMDYKMTGWNHRRSLRSPSFYVWPGGYRMYLRMYPRQSGENVYFHVGLTRGEHDASLQWPFRLKHRLAVLDQVASMTSTGPGSGPVDLVSRLWDPAQLCSGYNWQRPSAHTPDNYECVGLGFPQSLLRTRSYIRQDSALVKLTVCLSADDAGPAA